MALALYLPRVRSSEVLGDDTARGLPPFTSFTVGSSIDATSIT
jgi:hypothetical protein